MAVRTTGRNRPQISQLCEKGLHGFRAEVMMGACGTRKLRKNPATRHELA
jgi:hypothetical protein